MIGEIFFTLFIWPIYFLIEFLFVLFNRIFSAPGVAIVFLSIVVNTLCLPLYTIADRWQKEERELQKKMKKKLENIRTSFIGDERQMLVNAYYRQMGYSPVFMLRSSVGLLLQIPFFIAAYKFLSGTTMLSGVSFLFLNDLNAPDGLISTSFNINIMPFIMTSINLMAAFIYAKDLGKKERIQLFVMAFIFLVLLYNSPSGLVLYWTMNNVYSLIKNISLKYIKNPGIILKTAVVLFGGIFILLIWTGIANVERYRLLFTLAALFIGIIPLFWNRINKLFDKINKIKEELHSNDYKELYIWSFVLLFLLIGYLNPAQVFSASISDFETPWLFLTRTILQGLSILLLVPLFIRYFAPVNMRRIFAICAAIIAVNALICYFVLSAYYGVMDVNFKLDDTNRLLYAFPLWINLLVPLISVIAVFVFIRIKKDIIITMFFQITCAALFVLGTVNIVSMQRQYIQLKVIEKTGKENTADIYFKMSKTQPNVFIIYLDRAQGSAMADALEYFPQLNEDLDGFVFYPNTISFGSSTVIGVPPLLGGYNFTPDKINNRENELLIDKVNEAITTMPRMFGEAGFDVAITDPVIANMQSVADISIFKDMTNVTASLLSGRLVDRYRMEFPSDEKKGTGSFDFDILFRYGIFRAALPGLRYGIYYKGQWWREAAYNSYGRAIGEFSSLYYLNEICSYENEKPTLNILMNYVTHEGGSYNLDFKPQNKPVDFSEEEIIKFGSKDNAEYMYMLTAALKQIIIWIEYLKLEEIYDNTRIIIVSDHGGHYKSRFDTSGMEGYNPLLMVKDFDNRGKIQVNEKLMTNADTSYLAANDLNAIPIEMTDAELAKNEYLAAFSAVSSQPLRHGPVRFNLSNKRKLTGSEVLRQESWGNWEGY